MRWTGPVLSQRREAENVLVDLCDARTGDKTLKIEVPAMASLRDALDDHIAPERLRLLLPDHEPAASLLNNAMRRQENLSSSTVEPIVAQLPQTVEALAGGPPPLSLFEVKHRLGKKSKAEGGDRYYGCKSAVFAAEHRAHPGVNLVLKVIYNQDAMDTDAFTDPDMVCRDYDLIKATSELSVCPSIMMALGYFIGHASTETLGPSWDAGDFARQVSMIVVFEEMDMSLRSYCTRRFAAMPAGPPYFTAEEFLCILLRLIDATCHMHRARVVHRDIKPDNILVSGVRENPTTIPLIVRVSDFGEAYDAREEPPEQGLQFLIAHKSHRRGGAPHALAPEVVKPKAGRNSWIDYDKNDIFAVGLVAYYMLTGDHAFTATKPATYSRETYKELPDCYRRSIKDFVWELLDPNPAERLSCVAAEAKARLLLGRINDVSAMAREGNFEAVQRAMRDISCQEVELIDGEDEAEADRQDFVPLYSREGGIKLTELLTMRSRPVLDMTDAEWARVLQIAQDFFSSQLEQTQGKEDALVAQLGRLDDAGHVYNETRQSLTSDNAFGKVDARLEDIAAQVQREFPDGARQQTGDLRTLYRQAETIKKRYDDFIGNLCERLRLTFHPATLKGMYRAIEKCALMPTAEQHDYSRLQDIVRGGVTMEKNFTQYGLMLFFLENGERGRGSQQIKITKVKNRWKHPTDGGWADALLCFYFLDDPNRHICELQLMDATLFQLRRDFGFHHVYKDVRNAQEILAVLEHQRDATPRATEAPLPEAGGGERPAAEEADPSP